MLSVHKSAAMAPAGRPMPTELFGYEVIDFIGEGAGSVIYAVSSRASGQIYALKHVVKKREKDERFFAQLRNEFEVGRRLGHAALRRAIDLKDNGGLLRKPTEAVLVMEMFDGTPLDARRPGSVHETIEVFLQVARGLASLHATGFIHCDLKPANVLVNESGEAKVIDFGQACAAGTVKERIQGTPDFIAPEQVKCQPVTARTDVFNFGATMYWTLARRSIPTLYTLNRGENSFLVDDRIASPREIDGGVPETLSNLVMECVRTNPERRPADFKELTRRLEVVQFAVRRSAVA
jgi:eukaryotic-like serine/threonine-protein kinase